VHLDGDQIFVAVRLYPGSLLGTDDPTDTRMIDSTHEKPQHSAAGGKELRTSRLWAARAKGAT
jgi:hypothetical protein